MSKRDYNTKARRSTDALGRRVLRRALRDRARLLPSLVVGDAIGERVRIPPPPKRADED